MWNGSLERIVRRTACSVPVAALPGAAAPAHDDPPRGHVTAQTPPPALQELRAEVDAALEEALGRILPRLRAVHPALKPVADELATFIADGKRVRPALLLIGYAAGGGMRRSKVLGPALALEMLHTCALVHDDVIDRAETRRGRPSIHHHFTLQHGEARYAGDATTYGDAVAILLGDLAYVYADELFLEAGVAADALIAGFRRFTTLREEVTAGQLLDLHAAASSTTDRELAIAVATLKSGRYSVARPLEIGAALAGADTAFVDELRGFGDPLGRAFQVRDDLLGVFGQEELTGKSTSSDLAEGKRTLLIAETSARLDGDELAELEAGLGDATLSSARASRLRQLIARSGAKEATEEYVDDAVAEAITVLHGLDLPHELRDTLEELAHYLGARSA